MPRHLTSLISLIVAVRLAVQCGLAAAVNSRTAEPGKFRLRMGESFKITLFADLHFGEDAWTEWGPIQDFNSRRVMSSVLDLEQPGYKEFSFHGTTRMELMRSEIEKHAALSYSSIGPKDLWPGVSNYVLKVSSGDSQLPVAYMYFFDSGGGSFPEVISNAQVKWFQLQSTNLNANKSIPELIFWHIPSKSFKGMAAANSNGNQNCVGSIFGEQVASQKAEMGIMQILEQRSSVKAVFVGHNHGLDWCCPFNKLWLCYARHTGYGGYGNWARGSRTIEIKELPFSLKTWITMENGTSHSEVTLSS